MTAARCRDGALCQGCEVCRPFVRGQGDSAAQDRLIEKMRDRNHFLTILVGCASITADKERGRWRKRRLKRLTSDLAAVANEYSDYVRNVEKGQRHA